MDDTFAPPDPVSSPPLHRRPLRLRGATAVTAAGLFAGSLVGGYLIANAASSASGTPASALDAAQVAATSPAASPPAGRPPGGGSFDPSRGGHVGANGVVEKLLTGDVAARVTAAAQAAVPGATIERVETDAEGSPYEAHMVKSDGSHVTVKVDSNYKVTAVDDGYR